MPVPSAMTIWSDGVSVVLVVTTDTGKTLTDLEDENALKTSSKRAKMIEVFFIL
jgi:hypothetical protein